MNKEKSKRLKGSVLFTVVSVMSLLIVFLMGTLVLAASVNNRAHKSYSSSQTQYTARTAVDSVLAAVSQDPDFATAVASLGPGGSFDVEVNIGEASMGRVDDVTLEYAGTKDIYDYANQEWATKDLIKITATVNLGGESTTLSSYVLKDPVVVGDDSPPFLTIGAAATLNHTSAMGGTYFGVGENWASKMYSGNYPGIGDVSLDQKLYLNGTVEYDPVTGLPYIDTSTVKWFGLDNNSNNQVIEAPFVVDGNYYINSSTTFLYPVKKANSGVAIWGDLKLQNDGLRLTSVNLDDSLSYNFNEIPYLYVDGKIDVENSSDFGNEHFPLNIFCGSFKSGINGTNIYADVFCFDENETSTLGDTQTKLYSWSSSVINKADNVNGSYTSGNFYSKGSLYSSNNTTIAGDVRVEGDLTVDGNMTIGGDLVVGGTLTINGTLNVGGNMYASNASGSGVVAGTTTLKAGYTATTYNAIAAKNVKIYGNDWWYPDKPYAWVTYFALSDPSFSITDVDEEVDGTIYTFKDFGGAVVQDKKAGQEVDYLVEALDSQPDVTAAPTYDVYTRDSDAAVVDASEALIMGDLSYNGTSIYDPSAYIALGHSVFPPYAEKSVILGIDTIDDPSGTTLGVGDSQILRTVQDIMQGVDFDHTAITAVPSNVDVATSTYTPSTIPDVITGSCTISGGTYNKSVEIRADANAAIWVKFEGNVEFQAGNNIIFNDTDAASGTLNIFVDGSLTMNGGMLVTQTYLDILNSGTPFQIVTYQNQGLEIPGVAQPKSPEMYIYSKYDESNPPSLTLRNGGLVTGFIKAPYMNYNMPTAKDFNNEVYFNGARVRDYYSGGRVGVIGLLNANTGIFQNDWIFLHVGANGTIIPVQGADGEHTYASVDYSCY